MTQVQSTYLYSHPPDVWSLWFLFLNHVLGSPSEEGTFQNPFSSLVKATALYFHPSSLAQVPEMGIALWEQDSGDQFPVEEQNPQEVVPLVLAAQVTLDHPCQLCRLLLGRNNWNEVIFVITSTLHIFSPNLLQPNPTRLIMTLHISHSATGHWWPSEMARACSCTWLCKGVQVSWWGGAFKFF